MTFPDPPEPDPEELEEWHAGARPPTPAQVADLEARMASGAASLPGDLEILRWLVARQKVDAAGLAALSDQVRAQAVRELVDRVVSNLDDHRIVAQLMAPEILEVARPKIAEAVDGAFAVGFHPVNRYGEIRTSEPRRTLRELIAAEAETYLQQRVSEHHGSPESHGGIPRLQWFVRKAVTEHLGERLKEAVDAAVASVAGEVGRQVGELVERALGRRR